LIKESTLVEQLQDPRQKERAFRELISQYKERLYWHIRKIVISHDDADDVLQNTFIRIFKGINSFKQDSKLYSWIYRIATNESITFLSKKARERSLNIEDYQKEIVFNLQDDNLFDGDHVQLLLQKAIATLPHKQQLVFNMKYFDEMKYNEMAEILETSVGALKASYFHAVKKIKNYINSD